MVRPSSNRTESEITHQTLGFGVPATSDPHHFKVIIPKANSGQVQIIEYLGLQAQSDEFAVIERVSLERSRWTAVRAEVQRAFNTRLKSYGLKTSSWQVGENVVDRLLGKELCVLAWAIEDMEVDNISVAVRNWLALRPEERWWLFGMTAKSTGGSEDRDVGWRIALRHALGDIVQAEIDRMDRSASALLPKSEHSKPIASSNREQEPSSDVNDQSVDSNHRKSSQPSLPSSPSLIESDEHGSSEEETLFLFEAKQARALGVPVGQMSAPEFLVKKGSTVNITQAKSLRPAILNLRQKLLDEGILIEAGDVYTFAHEYKFQSPSAAACVIAGNPRSGMDAWRDLKGRSLKELGYGKKS